MQRMMLLVLTLGLALAAAPALAKGPFDGSLPLLCASADTESCEDDGACLDEDLADVRAATFFKVDLKAKSIQVMDEGRTDEKTDIRTVTTSEGNLILQGAEAGRGWTLLVDGEDGEFVLSVSDREDAMIVFGACTTL